MHQVTRRVEIDAGHRLLNHEGRCRNIHGHRYAFEITVQAEGGLDEVGRVIDFGAIKAVIGSWLDVHWDHGMLVEKGDPLIPFLVETNQKHAVLGCPPTAEKLAEIVFSVACGKLVEFTVVRVRCYETPNCWADWSMRR